MKLFVAALLCVALYNGGCYGRAPHSSGQSYPWQQGYGSRHSSGDGGYNSYQHRGSDDYQSDQHRGGYDDNKRFDYKHYGGHNCYGIQKKKVSYSHQKGFSYGDQRQSRGYYGRYCRTSYSSINKNQKCDNYGGYGSFSPYPRHSGYGGNDGYGWHQGSGKSYRNQCDPVKCCVRAFYGYSKCHGKVKLSHGYKYYYGKECEIEGDWCGKRSGGWVGYDKKKCQCNTFTCYKSIKACYYHKWHYYEDWVHIRVPCGCECNKKRQFW